ncbi:hypothetical protein SK128_002724 [Halocaridina rubra]|uniref:Protein-lysine N-methyltransferase SMYD4 n=1 Tax=Halocaridina rubra TaxID=373956 RepID=A0AAN8X1S4_HALRR
MEPFSCQPLFDRLTHVAVKTKAIEKFGKLKTTLEKLEFCWKVELAFDKETVISYKKEVEQILNVLYRQCSEHKKSEILASQAKEKGLKAYIKKKDSLAHHLFTDCLRYAPEGSSLLPLGYGNRSAVLFQMGRYKEALRDMERAEKKGYPSATFFKLLSRRCSCYIELGDRNRAGESLESCKRHLTSISAENREKYEKNIVELENKVINIPATSTVKIEEEDEVDVPQLYLGESQYVIYMSDVFQMKVGDHYGRHVVSTGYVPKGSVVFVEKPFASILLPEHYRDFCHTCFERATNLVPCSECQDAVFCSEECLDNSRTWHQYECGIQHILSSVGIAHLALRVILVAGWKTYCKIRNEELNNRVPGTNETGVYNGRNLTDSYRTVYHLMPHLDQSFPEDQLQYCLASLLLAKTVLDKTSFADQMGRDRSDTPELMELNTITLATAVMRHIAQLVGNAHAITRVASNVCSDSHSHEEITQKRIATAIYPTASLMNHSCKPTIINSFIKDTLVIRTIQNVKASDQIFNCYGPHYCRQTYKERQEALRSQYFFDCKCDPCTMTEYKLKEEIWSGFRCEACDGVTTWVGMNSFDSEDPNGFMKCLECLKIERPSQNLIKTCSKVSSLHEEAEEAKRRGDFDSGIKSLRSALNLGSKIYSADNHYLVTLRDTLARLLTDAGEYGSCCEELKECLRTTERRYGEESVELGHEMLKYTDALVLASGNNNQ